MLRLTVLFILGAAFLPTAIANAAPQCAPRSILLSIIKGKKYSENVIAVGASQNKTSVIEVYLNEETRTFTVLVTTVQSNRALRGFSCIVAGGVDFQEVEREPEGDPT